MEWFIAVLAVLALGVAAVAAAGGLGQMDEDPVRDTYAALLPDEPLTSEDVRHLRFGVGLRGYAMDQVDAVLDRLAAEIAARDARIAELTSSDRPTGSDEVAGTDEPTGSDQLRGRDEPEVVPATSAGWEQPYADPERRS